MAAQYQLQIITQEKKVFDGPVVSIVVPAVTGYLGVLAHHAPLVALLGEGRLTIRTPRGEEHHVQLKGGFLEVQNNLATLLSDEGLRLYGDNRQPDEEVNFYVAYNDFRGSFDDQSIEASAGVNALGLFTNNAVGSNGWGNAAIATAVAADGLLFVGSKGTGDPSEPPPPVDITCDRS